MASSVGKFFNEHLALVVSLLGALFVALRILAVSGFEPTTMLVMLRVQGTGSIIAGTLLPSLFLVPLMAGGVLVALAVFARSANNLDRAKRFLYAAAALFALAVLVAPMFALLAVPIALVGILIGWLLGKLARRLPALPWAVPNRSRVLAVALLVEVVLFALTYAFASLPWLSREVVADSNHEVVGYVLGKEGEDLLVLQDSPRGIVRLSASDATRSLCEDSTPKGRLPDAWSIWARDHLSKPLVGWLFGPETIDYPSCPD